MLRFVQEWLRPNKREILIYSILMGLALLISFSRNVLFAYVLEPIDMGYYSIVMTIASYGVLLQIGLMSGLSRELPVSLGKGNIEKSNNLIGETTTSVLFIQTFFLFIYFLVISMLSFEDSTKKSAFFLAGLTVIPAQLLSIVMLRLRSEQRTLAYSALHLVTTFVTVIIGFLAAKEFGFQGAIWTLIFVNIISFIIVSTKYLPLVNYLYFNRKDIIYLIKIGFPVMLSGVLVSFFLSMDKLFLIRFSTVENLGIYQIAFLPMILGVSIQAMVNQFMAPKLLYEYGAGSSLKQLYNKAFRVSLGIFILMIFIGPLVIFLINYIIVNWLTSYTEALPLISIFYIASIFIAVNLSDVIYTASNKPKIMFYQNSILVLIATLIFLSISIKPLIWFAYAVCILQLLKLLSSLLINFLIVENSKIP